MARAALLATFLPLFVSGSHAEGPRIPVLIDAKESLAQPDLSAVTRIRFLTTTDFPPFNFIDANGRLAGFHVDLARAMCAELGLADRCQIQAMPWDQLDAALARGDGEAIVAGIAVTAETRARYSFSRPYLMFPARFVVRRGEAALEPLRRSLEGKTVGVLAGSAHERVLADYFPSLIASSSASADDLLKQIKEGRISAVFGDGMRLGFWLAGTDSAGCCEFAGGPYLAPEYLGPGMSIAVKHGDETLVAAFDYALQQVTAKGAFAELYLRYFPVGFF